MKNNKVWYVGYVIGIVSLITMFSFSLNEAIEVALTLISALCISVSYVQLMHHKMLKNDKSYKISVCDERNEIIRDKVNATMAPILMLLMGIIAVVCISVNAYLPAALLAMSVGCSPLIMFFINRHFEAKY